MGLTALSVVCSVWTSSVYHQSTSNRKVPDYMRKSAYYLNKFVRVHDDMKAPVASCKGTKNVLGLDDISTLRMPLRASITQCNAAKYTVECHTGTSLVNNGGAVEFQNVHFQNSSPVHNAPKDTRSSVRKRCGTGPSHSDRCAHLSDELLSRLDGLLHKHDEMLLYYKRQCALGEINMEWRKISQVFDRFFFWIFMAVTFTVTIVILLIVPLCKADPEIVELNHAQQT